MTMVEKMARAIAWHVPLDASSSWNVGHGNEFPREYSPSEQARIRGICLLALKSMREPTDTMVAAGQELAGTINTPDSYQAMIDAAIAEAEEN